MTIGDSKLSILEHVYQRLNRIRLIDKVVFAIPSSTNNDKLAEFLDSQSISYSRGSEDDVLDRFYHCAIQYRPKIVIRATCDNPFVDWELGDKLIESLGNNDYVGCKDTPLGTSVEVFTMSSLEEAFFKASAQPEREHVTPYIIQRMNSAFIAHNGLSYRLTVDEERDLYVADILYKELYRGKPIPNSLIYQYLSAHQELASYNKTVHQKKL